MSAFDEIRKKRFLFLNLLYEKCAGSKSHFINSYDIGKELNLNRNQVIDITQYLKGEGLIEDTMTLDGGIMISHNGIKEVENALSSPSQPTHYFPAVNIINVQNMIGSQIQQGTDKSEQNGSFQINNKTSINEFIKQIKSELPNLDLSSEDKSEINSDIQTIESQISSSRPKKTILKESLLSIQRILEGVGSNVIATKLLEGIPVLLSTMG
jgi:hypothetical protein